MNQKPNPKENKKTNQNDVYKISESKRRAGPGSDHGAVKFDKDTLKVFGRLLTFFGKENIARLCIVVVCLLITALVSVKSSLFLGSLIDDYIAPMLGVENPDFAPLLSAIITIAIYYVLSMLASFVHKMTMVRVSNTVLLHLRKELFGHMQTLPVRFFDINSYGDIMSRYTNDIDNVRSLMSDSIPEVLSSVFTIVSVFVAMLKINLKLTGIVILGVIIMYAVTIVVGGNSAKYFDLRQKTLGEMNGYIEETLNGQKVVKVFNHEDDSEAAFDVKNEDLFRKSVKANAFSNILMPIMANIGNIQYVVIAIVGANMAINGVDGMKLGLLVSFLSLSRNFSHPMQMISQQLNSFVMALAGAKRVFAILDAPSEVDDGYVTLVKTKENAEGKLEESDEPDAVYAWKYPHHDGRLEYIKLCGDVVLDNVDFSYVPEKQILYDVNIYAKPGQKIAFVGSTGAGKTTITNLINRFYDIEDGKIRIDGININKIRKASLRCALGIVLQDTNLFTGTIADNIRYGKLDATMDEVVAAAKLANADSFIERLPEGYNTVISGNGGSLSQGQCQLIAIARCAIADPPIMILDEATSSIDTRTETLIQNGMDALMKGRTTFVIAHRLSTVQNSDAIMVVEGGHIIERGNHEDLIALQGRYYQLYTGKSAKQ